MIELEPYQINRAFSKGSERAAISGSRFGAPGLVREAVREAERATHRLRVERDTEASRRKRSELALEELSRKPADVPAALSKDLYEPASGAVTTPCGSKAKAVELKLAIEAHARRVVELDQAIADAILRIRLLSEPDLFINE